jgi:hypothetical protein
VARVPRRGDVYWVNLDPVVTSYNVIRRVAAQRSPTLGSKIEISRRAELFQLDKYTYTRLIVADGEVTFARWHICQ